MSRRSLSLNTNAQRDSLNEAADEAQVRSLFNSIGIKPIEQGFIPLRQLVDEVLQAQYEEFIALLPFLSKCSNSKRKAELIKFLIKTRKQIIKLLVLARWTDHSCEVKRAIDVVAWFNSKKLYFQELVSALQKLRSDLCPALQIEPDIRTAGQVIATKGSYRTLECAKTHKKYDLGNRLSEITSSNSSCESVSSKQLDTFLMLQVKIYSETHPLVKCKVSNGVAEMSLPGLLKYKATVDPESIKLAPKIQWKIIDLELESIDMEDNLKWMIVHEINVKLFASASSSAENEQPAEQRETVMSSNMQLMTATQIFCDSLSRFMYLKLCHEIEQLHYGFDKRQRIQSKFDVNHRKYSICMEYWPTMHQKSNYPQSSIVIKLLYGHNILPHFQFQWLKNGKLACTKILDSKESFNNPTRTIRNIIKTHYTSLLTEMVSACIFDSSISPLVTVHHDKTNGELLGLFVSIGLSSRLFVSINESDGLPMVTNDLMSFKNKNWIALIQYEARNEPTKLALSLRKARIYMLEDQFVKSALILNFKVLDKKYCHLTLPTSSSSSPLSSNIVLTREEWQVRNKELDPTGIFQYAIIANVDVQETQFYISLLRKSSDLEVKSSIEALHTAKVENRVLDKTSNTIQYIASIEPLVLQFLQYLEIEIQLHRYKLPYDFCKHEKGIYLSLNFQQSQTCIQKKSKNACSVVQVHGKFRRAKLNDSFFSNWPSKIALSPTIFFDFGSKQFCFIIEEDVSKFDIIAEIKDKWFLFNSYLNLLEAASKMSSQVKKLSPQLIVLNYDNTSDVLKQLKIETHFNVDDPEFTFFKVHLRQFSIPQYISEQLSLHLSELLYDAEGHLDIIFKAISIVEPLAFSLYKLQTPNVSSFIISSLSKMKLVYHIENSNLRSAAISMGLECNIQVVITNDSQYIIKSDHLDTIMTHKSKAKTRSHAGDNTPTSIASTTTTSQNKNNNTNTHHDDVLKMEQNQHSKTSRSRNGQSFNNNLRLFQPMELQDQLQYMNDDVLITENEITVKEADRLFQTLIVIDNQIKRKLRFN